MHRRNSYWLVGLALAGTLVVTGCGPKPVAAPVAMTPEQTQQRVNQQNQMFGAGTSQPAAGQPGMAQPGMAMPAGR